MGGRRTNQSGGRKSWFRKSYEALVGGSSANSGAPSRSSARPVVERLEDRRVLSAATLAVAQALAHSRENCANLVTGMYGNYLDRAPDAAGLNYWVGKMQGGLTDEHLEASFLGSPEYIANHGGTNGGWVDGMYRDLLHRESDDSGHSFWVHQLDAGAQPAAVAYGFAASQERETQRIADDYYRLLNRGPDSDGLAYWTNRFLQGTSNEDLVASFVGSDEYFAGRSFGDPREFIVQAYYDILNRAPSQQDVDGWAPYLPSSPPPATGSSNGGSSGNSSGSSTGSASGGTLYYGGLDTGLPPDFGTPGHVGYDPGSPPPQPSPDWTDGPIYSWDATWNWLQGLYTTYNPY